MFKCANGSVSRYCTFVLTGLNELKDRNLTDKFSNNKYGARVSVRFRSYIFKKVRFICFQMVSIQIPVFLISVPNYYYDYSITTGTRAMLMRTMIRRLLDDLYNIIQFTTTGLDLNCGCGNYGNSCSTTTVSHTLLIVAILFDAPKIIRIPFYNGCFALISSYYHSKRSSFSRSGIMQRL